jgi:hypothetical protein
MYKFVGFIADLGFTDYSRKGHIFPYLNGFEIQFSGNIGSRYEGKLLKSKRFEHIQVAGNTPYGREWCCNQEVTHN